MTMTMTKSIGHTKVKTTATTSGVTMTMKTEVDTERSTTGVLMTNTDGLVVTQRILAAMAHIPKRTAISQSREKDMIVIIPR